MTTTDEDFDQANRAFFLFTREERLTALRRFADLRYPLIEDRFVDAVHFVITHAASPAADRTEGP